VIAPIENEDLFNQVIVRNKGHFLFIAGKFAPSDEVMDLYQEIQCQLWKSLDRFKGRSTLETWAYGVALHTACAYKRNNDRREKALRAYEQDVQTAQMGGRDEERILREFEQSLPDAEQIIFTLYLTNMSYQEIAELTDIAEPILRVKISRIKNQFKQRYL
jgi:RNA polymerase sigma-70 factor, ECF subfamily